MVTSCQSQVAAPMTQLGAMIDERSAVTEQQAQEIDSEAKHRADLAFAVSMAEDATQISDAFEAFRRGHAPLGPYNVRFGAMQRSFRRGHGAYRWRHAPPGRAPRAGHYDRLILDHLDRRIFPSAHYSFP